MCAEAPVSNASKSAASAQAQQAGFDIYAHDPDSRGAKQYQELAGLLAPVLKAGSRDAMAGK